MKFLPGVGGNHLKNVVRQSRESGFPVSEQTENQFGFCVLQEKTIRKVSDGQIGGVMKHGSKQGRFSGRKEGVYRRSSSTFKS